MKQAKIQTPQSSTGLMHFYDVSTSNIQLDPKIVVGFVLALILLELLLSVI